MVRGSPSTMPPVPMQQPTAVVAEIEAGGGRAFTLQGDMTTTAVAEQVVSDAYNRLGSARYLDQQRWRYGAGGRRSRMSTISISTRSSTSTYARLVMATRVAAPLISAGGGGVDHQYGLNRSTERWWTGIRHLCVHKGVRAELHTQRGEGVRAQGRTRERALARASFRPPSTNDTVRPSF